MWRCPPHREGALREGCHAALASVVNTSVGLEVAADSHVDRTSQGEEGKTRVTFVWGRCRVRR